MKPRNLIIATVVLLGLGGAIYWAQKHPSSGSDQTTTPAAGPKLADISPSQVQSVQITRRDGTTISIQKQGGQWMITAPQQYMADQDAVSSMLASLNPLTADSVVQDSAANVAQFGLNPGTVMTVSVRENNGSTQTLAIGGDVPTTSLVYAKWGSSPKIYALNSSIKTGFDKSLNDLRDKRLLTIDSSKWNRLDLSGPKGAMEFVKNSQGDWIFAKPQAYRTDSFAVSELVRKLGDARMDLSSSAEDQAKSKTAFATGQPIATAQVAGDTGAQTLQVRKNKDDYYANSSVVPGAYKISSDLGQALDKGVDDFRNKKLFDFGFNDPDKIDLNGKTYVRAGADWKMNGQTMDPGTVQSLIDQLRELTATKFVTSGFTTPVATVTVQWNGYKNTDTLQFSRDADGFVARRAGDPALYQLDAKAVDDMLNAGNAIKPAARK